MNKINSYLIMTEVISERKQQDPADKQLLNWAQTHSYEDYKILKECTQQHTAEAARNRIRRAMQRYEERQINLQIRRVCQ